MDSPKKCSAGHTLIELTLAISLAGMLVGIVAVSYVTIYRGFAKQSSRMGDVQEMVRVKGEIDGVLKKDCNLLSFAPSRIVFNRESDTTVHTLSFSDKKLKYDQELLSKNASMFLMTLSNDSTAKGGHFLQWEVVFSDNQWIGGIGYLRNNIVGK